MQNIKKRLREIWRQENDNITDNIIIPCLVAGVAAFLITFFATGH